MQVVYCSMNLPRRVFDLDLFLWVLQCSGLFIVLIGLDREHWLRRRRRC